MTEELEQKAKKYAWNYPIPYSLYEKIEDKKEQMGEVIEQAYLAGLHEGLTKAKTENLFTTKELIEELVKIAEEPNSVSQGWYQIVMVEAKQFLNSEVEK